LLARAPHVIPIVGTTSSAHLRENIAAESLTVSADLLVQADACVNQHSVSGPRYPADTQAEIDTEEFSAN
jgi:aryl-alcohol dehydrogenase-like predicted oxidoreductase